MILFEAIPPPPSISEITICRNSSAKPISCFFHLACSPEQPGDGNNDDGRVVGFLQSVQ